MRYLSSEVPYGIKREISDASSVADRGFSALDYKHRVTDGRMSVEIGGPANSTHGNEGYLALFHVDQKRYCRCLLYRTGCEGFALLVCAELNADSAKTAEKFPVEENTILQS
jgi:hypothetical protein